jgi:uncharacterized membrane protein
MPDIFSRDKAAKHKTSKKKKEAGVAEVKKSAKQKIKDRYLNKHLYIASEHHNPLSSFSYIPREVKFINEDPDEVVILLLRKHPITNLKWIAAAITMLFIPSFIFIIPPIDTLPGSYQFALSLVWYLLVTAFVFEEFLSWFFHVNIVTDERIIDVNFHHLIYREITDAKIEQIQDMTVTIGGGLRTLLNFGTVYIQTAAQVPRIAFESVPQPDKVAKLLNELRIEEEQEKVEGRVR